MSASMDAISKGAEAKTGAGWQHQVYDLLRRNRITQFAYVPDAGHSAMEPGIRAALLAATERFKDIF